MKETRLTLLPDGRFAGLLPGLHDRLASAAASITPENFGSLLDETMRQVIRIAFKSAEADEGTVWLADQAAQRIAPVYNTGPYAARFIGNFEQRLGTGLLGMVLANERPFLENHVQQNAQRDTSLDTLLGVRTCALIAVPFYFQEACRGVISCVQLTEPGLAEPPARGFDEAHEAAIWHASATLGRLVDDRLLRAVLGLS